MATVEDAEDISHISTSPLGLFSLNRGLLIENRLRTNGLISSRYVEGIHVNIGKSSGDDHELETLMHDVKGDGNCAYRAVILGLEALELANIPAEERRNSSILKDEDDVRCAVWEMKETMFETMMQAVTGVELRPDIDEAQQDEAESRMLLTDEGYKRAMYLDLLEYCREPGQNEPCHLGVTTNPSRGAITVGWMRSHLAWMAKQDGLWLRHPWFSILSVNLRKNIIVYEPVGGKTKAVSPYNSIANNSLFFDSVDSEFVALIYHRSGHPFQRRGECVDGFSHNSYNHYGLLTVGKHHFAAVRDEIVAAAHATGVGGQQVSIALPTSSETIGDADRDDEVTGSGAGGEGSGAGEGGPCELSKDGQEDPAQCRARVGRAKKKGPDTRPRCTKLEQKVGSGLCGNHRNADLNPTETTRLKIDRTRRGAGEGIDSKDDGDGDDTMKPYDGEEGPLQGEPKGTSNSMPSVPDDMAEVIAVSKGIQEEKYREVYVDVGYAKQAPGPAHPMEQENQSSPGGEAAKQWTEEFPEADTDAEEWKNRHLMDGRDQCSPTDETLNRLPGIDTAKDQNLILGPLCHLAPMFFFIMFPYTVFEYILEKTNEYWKHCTTTYASEAEASRHNQTAEHRKENGIHGNARTPDGGYTITHLLGAIGITLMSAIVDTKCISLFWSISPNYNFPRVRNCMKRDYYYLIYSRHLRFEKSPGPGPEDAEYDTKYQIRKVEEKLNTAWSSSMKIGKWVSFDEQMVKCTTDVSRSIQRYNPLKAIKQGINCWAACCVSGYCYVSCVDGGFTGDKVLKKWAKDPLGKTTRMMLWVLLHACTAFAAQMDNSGVHIAMDNYFSSPLLMGCLATHLIFAFGTLRSNRAGVGGAIAYWAKKKVDVAREAGAMAFLRWGNMSITQWAHGKKVFFLSTVHIFKSDTLPQDYPLKVRGSKENVIGSLKQPPVREDYCRCRGGVHCRKGSTLICPHRPMNYFWRRVFEQKLMQAVLNAFILFRKWRALMVVRVDERIAEMTALGEDTRIQLKLKARLKRLENITRLQWVEGIADHLISQCKMGNAGAGGGGGGSKKRRRDKVEETAGQWYGEGFKGASFCFNRTCDKQYCKKGTRGVCGCKSCRVGVNGDMTRTRICSACCSSPAGHERALLYAGMKGRGKRYIRKLTAIPKK